MSQIKHTHDTVTVDDPSQYVYQTVFIYNNTADTQLQARTAVRREDIIVPNPEMWLVAVERWYIRNVELPVWRPNFVSGLTTRHSISFKEISSGIVTTQAVDANSTDPFKCWQRVAAVLNTTLNDLATATAAPSVPTFSWDNGVFTLNTNVAFRGAFKIALNQSLYRLLNTFDWESIDADETADDYAYFNLTGDAITQFSATTSEFSPVAKIVLESTIPMLNELLPQGIGNSSNNSQNTSNVLTDFVVFNDGTSNVFSYEFERTGVHRWHTMLADPHFKGFILEFRWIDKQGNSNPLYISYKNQAEVKLVMKRINSNRVEA